MTVAIVALVVVIAVAATIVAVIVILAKDKKKNDKFTPGSPVPGILQARTVEWVVISFSSA